jgi:hypothetical protein
MTIIPQKFKIQKIKNFTKLNNLLILKLLLNQIKQEF